jgi:amidase
MAENGALATTVADAALLLSVLAGRSELAQVDVRPRTLRIAASTRVPAAGLPLDRHWRAAVEETADLLRADHVVADADPSYPQTLGLTEIARWTAGTELDAQLVPDRDKLAARTRRHAATGRMLLATPLLRDPSGGGRSRWIARAERFFANHDVLLTPALAQPPIRALAWAERGWLANVVSNVRYAPFAAPWNLAGWPAMTVPAGLAPDGLPLAVQLVGRPGSEATLLQLAAQLEALRPWPRTAPMG